MKSPISHAAVARATNEVMDSKWKRRTSCWSLPIRRLPAASSLVDLVALMSPSWSSKESDSSCTPFTADKTFFTVSCCSSEWPGVLVELAISTASPCPRGAVDGLLILQRMVLQGKDIRWRLRKGRLKATKPANEHMKQSTLIKSIHLAHHRL